ncbi:MAG: beta-ketoacyl synthase N-terminal-like domain-containing protein, partial [Verrucomicrobiia bacterium]
MQSDEVRKLSSVDIRLILHDLPRVLSSVIDVLGVGCYAANGSGVDSFWSNLLCANTTAARTWKKDRAIYTASEPAPFADPGWERSRRRWDPTVVLSMAAVADLQKQLGRMTLAENPSGRTGLLLGSARGPITTLTGAAERVFQGKRPLPTQVAYSSASSLAGVVGTALGITEMGLVLSTACASAGMATAVGANLLQAGFQCLLVGGVDTATTGFVLELFDAASILARSPLSPSAKLRPFSATRAGTAPGEAAGLLALARRDAAPSRNVLASLVGWGSCLAPGERQCPDAAGSGLVHAMNGALDRAGVLPRDISAIVLHANGTT